MPPAAVIVTGGAMVAGGMGDLVMHATSDDQTSPARTDHAGSTAARDVHGIDRTGMRDIDEQHVWDNGDMYIQDDGCIVKVLNNGKRNLRCLQYLGAHAAHLEAKMAPGFTVRQLRGLWWWSAPSVDGWPDSAMRAESADRLYPFAGVTDPAVASGPGRNQEGKLGWCTLKAVKRTLHDSRWARSEVGLGFEASG